MLETSFPSRRKIYDDVVCLTTLSIMLERMFCGCLLCPFKRRTKSLLGKLFQMNSEAFCVEQKTKKQKSSVSEEADRNWKEDNGIGRNICNSKLSEIFRFDGKLEKWANWFRFLVENKSNRRNLSFDLVLSNFVNAITQRIPRILLKKWRLSTWRCRFIATYVPSAEWI